jgi:polyphosphate kinase
VATRTPSSNPSDPTPSVAASAGGVSVPKRASAKRAAVSKTAVAKATGPKRVARTEVPEAPGPRNVVPRTVVPRAVAHTGEPPKTPAPTKPSARSINRELSWLDFNSRVLSLAKDPSKPLLERVKFCAIFAGNLDEFFEVRVAVLKDQANTGNVTKSADGLRPTEQLQVISEKVRVLTDQHNQVFSDLLVPQLAAEGIEIAAWADLGEEDRLKLRAVFDDGIYPVLTPLAVDPSHPFPYISNLSLNLGAIVRDPQSDDRRFARVKIPPLLPRFVPVGDGLRWLLLEDLIAAQLPSLFPGMEIERCHAFRVTRNVDISVDEEEAEDLLEAVESELRRRRFGRAVRLEIAADAPPSIVEMLCSELELTADDVFGVEGPIDLTGAFDLAKVDRPDLKDEPWTPRTRAVLQDDPDTPVDFFSVVRQHDLLVHHPYDSFATSVENFISQAANDPDVLAIKLTLYRTSGDSPVVRSLIEASEQGKQVAALVELKARFDEQANITWARKLEEAGVHVVYGLAGLKTHTKVALVVRSEPEGLRRYVHIATGNYNSSTARLYEDLGLFTCDPVLGADLTRLFNLLTGFSQPPGYEKLVVAPTNMRTRVLELIKGEHPTDTRGPGHVVMKMNSLVDQPVIEALYEASQAGVRVDLIIRGICCLLPGVPGMSENIRVRSIVGRFLEHSRVWRFSNAFGDGKPGHFIGSADMMPRNLDRRIEAVVQVDSPALRKELDGIIAALMADTAQAWALESDGTWHRLAASLNADDPTFSAQEHFQSLARTRGSRL